MRRQQRDALRHRRPESIAESWRFLSPMAGSHRGLSARRQW